MFDGSAALMNRIDRLNTPSIGSRSYSQVMNMSCTEILSPGCGLGMSNITKDFVGASQKPCAELWALSLQVFQSYSLLTSYNDVVMSPYLLDVG